MELSYEIKKERPCGHLIKVSLEVFGDHTVLLTNIGLSQIDATSSFTVIINQQIADAFRTWFQFMWDASEEP